MQDVDLSGNQIKGVFSLGVAGQANCIRSGRGLKVLNLSRNGISSIQTDPIHQFAVAELNLSQNKLHRVDFLAQVKASSVKVLKLESNPFTAEREASLAFVHFCGNLQNLREVTVGLKDEAVFRYFLTQDAPNLKYVDEIKVSNLLAKINN